MKATWAHWYLQKQYEATIKGFFVMATVEVPYDMKKDGGQENFYRLHPLNIMETPLWI